MYIPVNINAEEKDFDINPLQIYKLYWALTDGHFDSDFVCMAH